MEEKKEKQKKKPAKEPRSRHWFLTLNNPTQQETDDFAKTVKADHCTLAVAQTERGEEKGTLHIQACVSFKHGKTFKAVQKLLDPSDGSKRWFIERCKDIKAAITYCSKAEGRVSTLHRKGLPEEVRTLTTFRGWQAEVVRLLDIKLLEREKALVVRELLWLWDIDGGKGKTALIKWLILNYDACFCGGKAADCYYAVKNRLDLIAEGKAKPLRLCVWNIPRARVNDIDYCQFEGIMDGLFFSRKYEAKGCCFNGCVGIVCANFKPDQSKLSDGRLRSINLDELEETLAQEAVQRALADALRRS